MLLKYTKDRQIEKMEEEQQWNNPNISLFEKTFLDLSKLKGVKENRDLFPSRCHLHYSNREISPQTELVFPLKIREYRM